MLPLIAAVTSHQAEGRSERRGKRGRGCPPRLAGPSQGPALSVPSQQQSRPEEAGRRLPQGGRGGVALGPRATTSAAEAEPLPRARPLPGVVLGQVGRGQRWGSGSECLCHLGMLSPESVCALCPGGSAGLEAGCWGERCDSRAQLLSISPGLGPAGVSEDRWRLLGVWGCYLPPCSLA